MHAINTRTSGCFPKRKSYRSCKNKKTQPQIPTTAKRALVCVIGVAVDALKSRYKRDEVSGLKQYMLAERRRKALELKWCSPQQSELITSIWCPLPYPCDIQGEENNSEDEEAMFVIPMSRSQFSQGIASSSQSSRKRRRPASSAANDPPKKPCNTILNYYSPNQD